MKMEETSKSKSGVNIIAVVIAFVFGLTLGQVDVDKIYKKTSGEISRTETTQISTVAYKDENTSNATEALTAEKAIVMNDIRDDGAETVYRTPTGKRYHLDSYCAGVNYIESTVEESTALGLTPCKKCAGG